MIEEDHLLVILGHHAILVLHRHAMQHPGLTVVIFIPLQKEGITQDLFHPERGGTVKRGHIHDQGATAKLQIGVRSGAQLGAQLGAEAVAQEEAEAVAQFMMNILKK